MQAIQGIELNEVSREELLPGFETDFPYIATCAELDKYIEPGTPWHWHRPVELFYMESGCLEYTTPHGKWIFPAGSGGFVNSNVLHTTRVQLSGSSNIQLLHLFDPALLSGGHGSRMESRYILPLTAAPEVELIPLFPEDEHQARLLGQIRHAFSLSPQEWGYEFRLREVLTDIWLELYQMARPSMEQTGRGNDPDSQIKALMVYIHEHYREPISVAQLAEAAHISQRLCFRLFQETLHMTPVEYMRGYRLQQARQRIVKTREPLTRIACDCGLGSSSYFGKVFRERFGCSPSEYRRQWQDRDSNKRE